MQCLVEQLEVLSRSLQPLVSPLSSFAVFSRTDKQNEVSILLKIPVTEV